jgi:hypothetical protein
MNFHRHENLKSHSTVTCLLIHYVTDIEDFILLILAAKFFLHITALYNVDMLEKNNYQKHSQLVWCIFIHVPKD